MPAKQTNALINNPNAANLTEVAIYKRAIRANLDRVWENVLDWAHLPWLHESSFDYVELDEAGEWGWRTWSNAEHSGTIELCVDRANNRYVTRTYEEALQVAEIWTELEDQGEATNIRVSFLLANIRDEGKDKIGKIMLDAYTQLWDEDEAMMMQRQIRLDEPIINDGILNLGPIQSLKLPMTVRLGNKNWRLLELDGELFVQAADCPHLRGPLEDALHKTGEIKCPWHGYRFNVDSGECVSPVEANCKLPTAPTIDYRENGTVNLIRSAA